MPERRDCPIICIFGNSRVGPDEPEFAEAESLGRQLAEHGFIVCTGGYGGVMEAASRGARGVGGHVIGVTSAVFKSAPNHYLSEEIRTSSLFERMERLSQLGSGYVAVRGGIGTVAEVSVMWNLMVIKAILPAPPLVFVGSGWRSVVESWKDHLAVDERDLPYVSFAANAHEASKDLARSLAALNRPSRLAEGSLTD